MWVPSRLPATRCLVPLGDLSPLIATGPRGRAPTPTPPRSPIWGGEHSETFWVSAQAGAPRMRPTPPALTRLLTRAAHPGTSTRPAPASAGGALRLDVHVFLAGGRRVRELQLGLLQLHLLGCKLGRALRGLHPTARALPAAARLLAPAAAAGPLGSSGPRRAGACARARAPAPGSARLSSAALPPRGARRLRSCTRAAVATAGAVTVPPTPVQSGLGCTLVLLCLGTDREGRLVLSPGASGLGAFCCFRKTVCLNWAW